ncbi:hypothetical protein [Actinorhabdospora filicis]|uniref:hypothetical protein n=1 Tax=Actinorhabdospora filicis TaxID=1785913 RepID=UPI0025573B46|nr:hypothetical protein [Actinorhabdospora filicis]
MPDDENLPGLLDDVALGRADSERLDTVLFRDRLHPEAVAVIGPVIDWVADPRLAEPLIMSTLVELASHPGAEPTAIADALTTRADTLLDLAVRDLTGDSGDIPREAAVLLGYCHPDPELSARVRRAAGDVTDPLLRAPLIASAARLDPAAADWLTGLLAPDRPPITQAAAVAAMSTIGIPATDAVYAAFIRARLAHPDPWLLTEDCGFRRLIDYLGDRGDAALAGSAPIGSPPTWPRATPSGSGSCTCSPASTTRAGRRSRRRRSPAGGRRRSPMR